MTIQGNHDASSRFCAALSPDRCGLEATCSLHDGVLMRTADLGIVERFERLTRYQIVECAVYTLITNTLCMILLKVAGLDLAVLPLCAIWNFHCLLGEKMGYASGNDPVPYIVVGAASFVVGIVMYVILLVVGL